MLLCNISGVLLNLFHMFSTKISCKMSAGYYFVYVKAVISIYFLLIMSVNIGPITTLAMHAKSNCNVSNRCSAYTMPTCVLGTICEQFLIVYNYQFKH